MQDLRTSLTADIELIAGGINQGILIHNATGPPAEAKFTALPSVCTA